MRKIKLYELNNVIDLMKLDIDNCLYIYIDIVTLGIDNPNMDVWVNEENGNIHTILMKYYDSVWIYAKEPQNANLEDAIELLKDIDVSMIAGQVEIIEKICCDGFFIQKYKREVGYLLKAHQQKKEAENDGCNYEQATIQDSMEIAKLICLDEKIGGHYDVENLAQQLSKRMSTNTGRSWVIRENKAIVSHVATYAQTDGIGVIGGVITSKECRGKGYGGLLLNYVHKLLQNEDKQVYQFVLNENAIEYFRDSYYVCTKYAKISKK